MCAFTERRSPRRVMRDRRGATALEFAMVVPVFLLMLFGLIEGARLFYDHEALRNYTSETLRAAIVATALDDPFTGVAMCAGPVPLSNPRTPGLDPARLTVTANCQRNAQNPAVKTITVTATYQYKFVITAFGLDEFQIRDVQTTTF